MKIACSFGHASGMTSDECHALAYRYDSRLGFRPEEGESHIIQFHKGRIEPLVGKIGWLTDLWRSPADKVYVTDADSRIYFNPDPEPRKAPWQHFDLPGMLSGIWGLDDQFVLAWGQIGQKQTMFRWDGAKWSQMDSPGEVNAVHGIRRDFVYAVGAGGLIARWDGSKWNRISSPARTTLSGIFVASEDEIYACGQDNELLEGSIYGWSMLLDTQRITCIAKWKNALWVGCLGPEGLSKLEGNKLVSVKPNIKALFFDTRKNLVITTINLIADTSDGIKFEGVRVDHFAKTQADRPPMWKKEVVPP